MTKKELIGQGFKYIATQNCEAKTEIWARFSGWDDVIQYYYYFPNDDMTSPTVMTITYVGQLDMFAQMRDKMQMDWLNRVDVNNFDKTQIWSDKQKNT